jgi:hypothetical protein
MKGQNWGKKIFGGGVPAISRGHSNKPGFAGHNVSNGTERSIGVPKAQYQAT